MKPANASVDLHYLEAELARVDLLIRREVRRWVVAGQDPNDDYRGMYIAQAEAVALLERPFGVSWGQWVELPPDEADAIEAAFDQATQQLAAMAQHFDAQGLAPRLLELARAFELDRTALDILLLCVAPAFDTKYERLYGYLQDNVMRRRPSVRLVLDLLGGVGAAKFALAPYLEADAPLFAHRLIEHVIEPPPANAHWLNQTLHVDETVVAWLRGGYAHHGVLAGHARLEPVELTPSDQILAGDFARQSQAWRDEAAPLLAFYGGDRTRQDAAARSVAWRMGKPLLTVAIDRVAETQPARGEIVRTALRDARLTGAVAYLCGWETCLNEDRAAAPEVLSAICDHPGPVVLAADSRWQPGGIDRTRAVHWAAFDMPTTTERQALWRHFLHQRSDGVLPLAPRPSPLIADAVVDDLAAHFVLTAGKIRDAVAAACDMAGRRAPTADELFATARAYSNPRLSALARKIEPRFAWDDIVLPENQLAILHELVAAVRHRPQVLETWGVGRKLVASAGVTVLFAGPPGTGKTMAAEVIARSLGLDLYKIDLAQVVSKYIGETEKNLERIFSEAASSNAILFFDEADAIFGKRSEVKDAHDRYANIEVSYLLQRMEQYDGVTILATNLRANLDEAFTRRLQFVVDFPFPQAADRLRIWQTLLPPETPCAADIDFGVLAQRFELSGGAIRNILVSAAYLAADNGQVVTMAHLLHGTRRELQKMGRMVGESEFSFLNGGM